MLIVMCKQHRCRVISSSTWLNKQATHKQHHQMHSACRTHKAEKWSGGGSQQWGCAGYLDLQQQFFEGLHQVVMVRACRRSMHLHWPLAEKGPWKGHGSGTWPWCGHGGQAAWQRGCLWRQGWGSSTPNVQVCEGDIIGVPVFFCFCFCNAQAVLETDQGSPNQNCGFASSLARSKARQRHMKPIKLPGASFWPCRSD